MEISFEPGRNRVVVRVSGRVTLADMVGAYREMLDHPRFRPGMQALWRLENTEGPALSADEIREFISTQRDSIERRGPAWVAVFVERDLDFGVVRMYEALSQGLHIDVRGFRDLDEAVRWLDDQPSEPGSDR